MTRSFAVMAVAAAAFAAGPAAWAQSAEPYVSYDTFNASSNVLEPGRWQLPERVRVMRNGVLNLAQRDYGNQFSDAGLYSNSWSITPTASADSLRQLRATVKVNEVEVSGCEHNPEPSTVQARLIGSYFNTGFATAGDRTNDLLGIVRMVRQSDSSDPSGVLRVQGLLWRCLDSSCDRGAVVGNIVDLGTVNVGEAAILRMDWDQARSRFLFRRGSQVVALDYGGLVGVGSAPGVRFKALQTRTSLANCFGGQRTHGFIDADFDSVFVNASAAP